MRLSTNLVAALALLGASLGMLAAPAHAEDRPEIKLGFAKCAHCTPLTLTPAYAKDIALDVVAFNTGNDVLTALVSKSIDVAQVTYLHYVTALDKGFDVVAISGQVNGGSQILVSNDLPVAAGDWAGLKALAAKRKAEGQPLKVAASRGNAQDIHMRGAFAKQGTNLIVTRSDVVAAKTVALRSTVGAIVKGDDHIAADHGAWAAVITKVTGLDKAIADGAIANLEPDYRMYEGQALAIATMMRDLRYISHDVSGAVVKNMDYTFLEAATGKTKAELGGR